MLVKSTHVQCKLRHYSHPLQPQHSFNYRGKESLALSFPCTAKKAFILTIAFDAIKAFTLEVHLTGSNDVCNLHLRYRHTNSENQCNLIPLVKYLTNYMPPLFSRCLPQGWDYLAAANLRRFFPRVGEFCELDSYGCETKR